MAGIVIAAVSGLTTAGLIIFRIIQRRRQRAVLQVSRIEAPTRQLPPTSPTQMAVARGAGAAATVAVNRARAVPTAIFMLMLNRLTGL